MNNMNNKIKIIGLTGTNGAGKGEAAAFFHRHGYESYSLSDILREELVQRGLALSRDNLIKIGNELRRQYGADILARRAWQRIKNRAVIDSIRNPGEVTFFRQHAQFILIAIDAPVEVRFQRILKRGRAESVQTLPEFKAKEAEERSTNPHHQQLQACLALADYLIINDGTLEEFYQKLARFI
jgi:dephospho-CoA kinase